MEVLVKDLYTKKSKIYIALYILCIFIAAMGDWKTVNGMLGALPKVVSAGAVGLAVIYFLWSGNFRNLKTVFRFGLLYGAIVIGIIFCSILIWILELQTFSYILKGSSKILFQVLNVLIVVAAVYMFEEKAGVYTFIGIAAANFTIILLGAVQTGISAAVQDMIRNITTFGANEVILNSKFIRAIEIHDITFTMGVFFLYFMFFCPGEKYRYV